ncbi:hypothetical protein [Streptomyces aurantiacus]|uniref:hypothetical protein n=1 Tax=Streptomyces aurantiacus TaxID=47760 RepID=UPI0027D91CEC|nr:hypothetical protein [Streptomyces aurantiacus]
MTAEPSDSVRELGSGLAAGLVGMVIKISAAGFAFILFHDTVSDGGPVAQFPAPLKEPGAWGLFVW